MCNVVYILYNNIYCAEDICTINLMFQHALALTKHRINLNISQVK